MFESKGVKKRRKRANTVKVSETESHSSHPERAEASNWSYEDKKAEHEKVAKSKKEEGQLVQQPVSPLPWRSICLGSG